MHWREMMESLWFTVAELHGKEMTVTIEKVNGGTVVGEKGRKRVMPVLRFKGVEKPLATNVTNCRAIASMYGNDVRQWPGKEITLIPGMTQIKRDGTIEDVPCVRVRPGKAAAS